MKARANQVKHRVLSASDEVIPFFEGAATELLASVEGDAEKALAMSLAALSGWTEAPKARSLLSHEEGYVTMKMMSVGSDSVRSVGDALRLLRFNSPRGNDRDDRINIGRVSLLSRRDEEGAVFDLPEADAHKLLAHVDGLGQRADIQVEIIDELPQIQSERGGGGGGRCGRGGGYRGGRGGGGYRGGGGGYRGGGGGYRGGGGDFRRRLPGRPRRLPGRPPRLWKRRRRRWPE